MSNDIPSWRKQNIQIKFDLTSSELVWRDRQRMLESHGYLLRPRFRPEWVPSWLNTKKKELNCEDSVYNPLSLLIDAKRLSDGKQVILKVVDRDSAESSIGSFFSSEDRAQDPANHCVPILDIIRDESLPIIEFIVMPLLRPFNKPPFFSVDEVLDFMKQTLEGLSFMHRMGVAHRDCSDKNIMFDAAGMFPKGFHASVWGLDANGEIAEPLRRRDAPPVRYFFTDFGLSTRYLEGGSRFALGRDGLDQEVPELSDSEPYDPFALDVFVLGNVFKRNFLESYTNMAFISPLLNTMLERNPSARPSIEEALARFNELTSTIPGYARRWRLRQTKKGRIVQLIQDIGSVRRECFYVLNHFFVFTSRRILKKS